jgi:hypothetical protein
VLGVEFALEFHRQATDNIERYRHRRRRCRTVSSVAMDAADYRFPDEKLVLYFFNPFGREVMQAVLRNLANSIERNPREVWVVMVYPELAELLDGAGYLRLYKTSSRYRIYRLAHATAPPGSPRG